MPKPSECFGKNLKSALTGEKNQTWLAKELKIRVATVSDWVNGKTVPDLKDAEAAATAVGLPLSALIGDEPPRKSPEAREPNDEDVLLFLLRGMNLSPDKLEVIRLVLRADGKTLAGVRRLLLRPGIAGDTAGNEGETGAG